MLTSFSIKLLIENTCSTHKENLLKNIATWMKQKCITYSVNCVISKYVAELRFSHAKKNNNCFLNESNAENDYKVTEIIFSGIYLLEIEQMGCATFYRTV